MNPEDESILNQSDKLQIASLMAEKKLLIEKVAASDRDKARLAGRLRAVSGLLNAFIHDSFEAVESDNSVLEASLCLIDLILEGLEDE
tara:strand:- start:235 stop:498 length:264 start_codon:yes stop_codon:yes gene_type:complete